MLQSRAPRRMSSLALGTRGLKQCISLPRPSLNEFERLSSNFDRNSRIAYRYRQADLLFDAGLKVNKSRLQTLFL
jgi:hypothetical protein